MKIKKIGSMLAGSLLLGLLLAPFGSGLSEVQAGEAVVIHAEDYGADPTGENDSTQAIQDAFAAAKEATANGASSVTVDFPKGTYQIYKDKALTREYHTSNTNSTSYPTKTIGILIEGQENFTLEGNDSLFMMHGNIMALAVVKSENVKLQNFSWDFGVPTVSEMTVIEMGTEDGKPYTDFLIPACFPHEISGTTIKWYSEKSPYTDQYYWTQTGNHSPTYSITAYQPESKMARRYGTDEGPFNGVSSIRELDETHVRIIYRSSRPSMQQMGTVIELAANGVRETAGAFIWESENVTSEKVNVHYMHGFGWLVQMSRDVYFKSCNLMPREGSGHITVSFADGIHASGAAGELVIEDCNFSDTHDDPINLHGTFTRVEQRQDDHTLTLKYIHDQQGGFPQYHVGDKVAFFTRDTLESTDSETLYTVSEVVSNPGEQGNNGKTMVIRFAETLPANLSDRIGLEPKYVAENVTYAPKVTVRNCTFENMPARGILCTTRQPVLIEGNTFKKMSMATIYLSNDSNQWYESGPIRDMTIRNNEFFIDDIGRTEWEYAPAIYVHPVTKGGGLPSEANPIHKNITIEGNTFHMALDTVVKAESVENLTIKNNKILRMDANVNITIEAAQSSMLTGNTLMLKTAATGNQNTGSIDNVYEFTKCKNVVLEGNTYDDGLKRYAILQNMSEGSLTNKDADITVLPTYDREQPASAPATNIKYRSSNPDVISVNDNGLMTAKRAGKANIEAYYEWNGQEILSNSVEMEVKDTIAPEDVVKFDGDENVVLSESEATITFEANTESGKTITWSVEDFLTGGFTDAAVISENGVLTAKKNGIVWVRASAGVSSARKAVIISIPGQVMNTNLTIKREDTQNYTLEEYKAIVDMQEGDLYNEKNNVKNLFLYEIPADISKDNMRTVIKVDNMPVRENGQWDTASFLLYKDDDNYISAGKKSHYDGIATVVETSGAAEETGGSTDQNSLTTAYLGFYKKGNKISVDFRTENGSWTHVRDIETSILGDDYKIGFTGWESNDRGKSVTFSEFRVGSGDMGYVDLCAEPAIPFKSINRAPSGTNAKWEEQDTYHVGDTVGVTYDFADPNEDAEGKTLYLFTYENGVEIVTDKPETKLELAGKVTCQIYPADSKGMAGSCLDAGEITVREVERTDLQSEVEKESASFDAGKYTAESAQAYQAALDEAARILNDAGATQADIDDALSALREAKKALVLKASEAERTELTDEIKSFEALDKTQYTETSIKAYQEALESAKLVLNNANATQEEIKNALESLRKAKGALVEKDKMSNNPIKIPDIPGNPGHEAKAPAAGTAFDVNGIQYKVLRSDAKNGTVAVVKLTGKAKSKLTVPATVQKDGYTFKVTSIEKKAFQKNKKLKTLVIGSNVTQIGQSVFYKCTKLKTITFKGTKAPKIGKKAFKGISAKCKIQVPKKMTAKQLKTLKKRMKTAGAGSKAVYKKK